MKNSYAIHELRGLNYLLIVIKGNPPPAPRPPPPSLELKFCGPLGIFTNLKRNKKNMVPFPLKKFP